MSVVFKKWIMSILLMRMSIELEGGLHILAYFVTTVHRKLLTLKDFQFPLCKFRGLTVPGYFWESIIYLDMLVEVKRWHFRQLVTKFCCPQEEEVLSVACTMVWKEGEIMYNCVAAEIFCFAILKRISCRRAMTKKQIFFVLTYVIVLLG